MDDKTPIYMVLMVALVALVGLVVVLTHGGSGNTALASTDTVTDSSNTGLTGNVVYGDVKPALNTFGKIFFSAFLVGIAAYMYFRREE